METSQTTATGQPGAVATPTATTTWQIDPAHSLVEFSVKHMMFTTVKGRFGDVRGSITLDEPEHIASRVEVEIGVTSIDTRDEKRDAHLRSADFFDAERYPTMTFRSTRVERRGGDKLRLVGELTLHGVTREVVLDAEETGRGKNPWGQDVIGFSATAELNRKDFGLTWNVALESGGVLVSDKIKIALDIQAARGDATPA